MSDGCKDVPPCGRQVVAGTGTVGTGRLPLPRVAGSHAGRNEGEGGSSVQCFSSQPSGGDAHSDPSHGHLAAWLPTYPGQSHHENPLDHLISVNAGVF